MKKLLFITTGILISLASFSQSCLPDGIDFNNQAAIDNFQLNYPGCTVIEGNVEIQGDDILNLDGLSVLTSIGGYLYITNNDSLDNLSGLASLTSVGGSLLVSSNASLTGLAGLENLSVVEEDVFISTNPVLTDISALGNIIAENMMELRISGNSSLATCDNPFTCSYLSNPPDKVNIYGNAPGCDNPPEIAVGCGITLPCLPFGNYNFFTQADIDDFQLNYPGCTELAGVVKISGSGITSLDDLNVLNAINGSLEIHTNPQLASLAGLDSLDLISGAVTIVGNSLLTDITALSFIDTSSITFLGINNNPILSACEVQSVCDYLSGPFGSSHNNIAGNDDGCKTRDEVLQACTVGVDESIYEEAYLNISPNPASTQITIKTLGISSKFQISILNLNGKEILRQNAEKPSTVIDISNLPSGVYFLRLNGEGEVSVEKFVKVD
jgi:hypothetical protein